jgi:hypothetical protein
VVTAKILDCSSKLYNQWQLLFQPVVKNFAESNCLVFLGLCFHNRLAKPLSVFKKMNIRANFRIAGEGEVAG